MQAKVTESAPSSSPDTSPACQSDKPDTKINQQMIKKEINENYVKKQKEYEEALEAV